VQKQPPSAAVAEADDEYPRSLESGDMLLPSIDRQHSSALSGVDAAGNLALTANPMFAAAAGGDSGAPASSAFLKQDPNAPGSLGRAFGRRSVLGGIGGLGFGNDGGGTSGVRRVGSAPDLAKMAEEAAAALALASPSTRPVASASLSPAKTASSFAAATDSEYSSLSAPSLSASSISVGAPRRNSVFGAGFGGGGDIASTPFQSTTLATGVEYADAITAQSTGSAMVLLTIPVPRSSHSAREYMRYLDAMSSRLCADTTPVLFVRGNNRNILTPWL
jgi:hypothetical protein